jgi:hypothetical protein
LNFWKAFPNYGLRYTAGTVQTDKQTKRYFSLMVGVMNDPDFNRDFMPIQIQLRTCREASKYSD